MASLVLSAFASWHLSVQGETVPGSRWVVQKLRTYCKACHAVGQLRFIYNELDDDVWAYLFTYKAPNSKKLWSEAIYDVLNWPSDAPPPLTSMYNPPNEDWMPKGIKRHELAQDVEKGTPVRRLILQALAAGPTSDE